MSILKYKQGGIFLYQTGGLTKPKSLQEAEQSMIGNWSKTTKPVLAKPYVKPPLSTGAIESTFSPIDGAIFARFAPARGLSSVLLSQVSSKPLAKLAGSALDIVDPTALGFKKYKEKGYNTHKNTSLDNRFNTLQRYTEQASNVDNVNDYRNYMSLQDKTIEKPKQELKTKSDLEKSLDKKRTVIKQG